MRKLHMGGRFCRVKVGDFELDVRIVEFHVPDSENNVEHTASKLRRENWAGDSVLGVMALKRQSEATEGGWFF